MRSNRRYLPRLSLLLACSVFAMLLTTASAYGAPAPSPLAAGAVGGDWQAVNAASLAGQRITALLPNGRNGMWVGSEERGLAAWDGRKWRTYGPREGLPDSRVVALFLDRQGRLWISSGGGLGYLPKGGAAFHRIGLSGLRSLPILAFEQASDGAILLGSASGLAVWRSDGALQSVAELNGLAVLALRRDRNGSTWAGTSAGLWRGTGGRWQRDPSLGDGRIVAIAESPEGRLYAAGETGVWERLDRGWRRLEAPAKGELAAVAARDGSVWLGTSQGVAAGQEGVWETYDPGFLPQAKVTALAWAGSGELWVGTPGGLVTFRPDADPPRVAIVAVNGLSRASGVVRLSSDSIDRVQIEAGDRTTPEASLRLFTRLEGVDASPRLLAASERRDLKSLSIYAGRALAPGEYVLRVWAQDDAFNRSPESQVTVVVPALAHVPGGLAVPREAVLASVAGLALVLAAGATTAAARRTMQRHAEHEAQAMAARVRAVADRSVDLYAVRLPLREGLVGEALDALQHQSLLLLGHRGLGKTAFIEQLALSLPARSDRSALVAPACVDLAAVREEELFPALMTAATAALYPFAAGARPRLLWSEGAAPGYGEQEFSGDLGVLLAWLQPQLGRRLSLVFLLDNADVLDGYEGRQRDAFRRLLVAASGQGSSIRLALAAESTPETVAGFADLFHTLVLAPLDGRAASRLLREGTRGLLDWEPDAERAAIARAGGSPARLANLGRAAGHNALANNRLCITGSDVP